MSSNFLNPQKDKNQDNVQAFGFPSVESARLIDKLYSTEISRILATGRLKPNEDMNMAIQLTQDLRASIEAKGGVDLWLKISEKGHKMILQGELNEDDVMIGKGERILSRINTQLLEDYLMNANLVNSLTNTAMGSSISAGDKQDKIIEGFANTSMNISMNKKPSFNDNEMLDLRNE
jgi:hypothetical protein